MNIRAASSSTVNPSGEIIQSNNDQDWASRMTIKELFDSVYGKDTLGLNYLID
jgi:hypothetical protein